MTILDYKITPANTHDCKFLIPLVSNVLSSKLANLLKKLFGDNAYNTKTNRDFCHENHLEPLFHSKDETGKHPKKKRSAKKKSKKRSKIEPVFGISKLNLGFGSVRVRGIQRVSIDTDLIFIGWNLGILYSHYIDQFEDRISLKRLLYKN
jgi:hypothetical protein